VALTLSARRDTASAARMVNGNMATGNLEDGRT
jgi:hypothetical protein